MQIRPLNGPLELAAAESLQRQVWGCADVEVVPAHLMQAQAQHGGCLLGGWEGPDLVGMVFAFPAGPGTDYLYSHIAAVARERQGRGLGARLKQAQADWARERGYRRIVWTFDPLQVANARLNLNKLGAVASRYKINYYGELQDELNAGVETDRFEVDWWLTPVQREPVELVVRFPWPLPPEQRRHWRGVTRAALTEALAAGLAVVGVEVDEQGAAYRLARVAC